MTTPSDPNQPGGYGNQPGPAGQPGQPDFGGQPGGYGAQPGQPGGYGNQPGYAQSGLPGFPAAPPPMEQQQAQVDPPSTMTGSFWCYLVAAVIGIVGALLSLGQRQTLIDTLQKNNTTGLSASQIDKAANLSLLLGVIFAVILGGLFVLFAFKLRAGRNWARIVLLIVAILDLLSLLVAGGNLSILGLVGDLAAIAGAVLSYLPVSNAYISAVKHARFR